MIDIVYFDKHGYCYYRQYFSPNDVDKKRKNDDGTFGHRNGVEPQAWLDFFAGH